VLVVGGGQRTVDASFETAAPPQPFEPPHDVDERYGLIGNGRAMTLRDATPLRYALLRMSGIAWTREGAHVAGSAISP
jgi:hypothetical protein